MEKSPYNLNDLDLSSLSSMKSLGDITKEVAPDDSNEKIAIIVDHINWDKQNVPTESLNVNGRLVQESMDKYLAAKMYLSSGDLKEMNKSPFNYFYYHHSDDKDKIEAFKEEKKHFKMGTFIHECLLEPGKFDSVVAEPKLSRGNRDGVDKLILFWENKLIEIDHKAYLSLRELFPGGNMTIAKEHLQRVIDATGLKIISEDNYLEIKIIERNYKRYAGGILPKLMVHGKSEASVYGTDPETGLGVRVRPDRLLFAENVGLDIVVSAKTTNAESLSKYYYDTAKYQYETSEAMYQDVVSEVTGRQFKTTLNIVVQTCAPYGVALTIWNNDDIDVGRHKYKYALQSVLDCEESGKYPGFEVLAEQGHHGIIKMKQPDWNKKELHPVDIEN